MHRYHILVEYVGTNFHGWQTQSNGKTIQKTIEQKIKKIINEKVKIIGSGRTDSGVHAFEQSIPTLSSLDVVDHTLHWRS